MYVEVLILMYAPWNDIREVKREVDDVRWYIQLVTFTKLSSMYWL